MPGGYVQALSHCVFCDGLFSYNPHKVPSVRVYGERQPVCESCMTWINAFRAQKDLKPLEILPGAYDPMPEEEL